MMGEPGFEIFSEPVDSALLELLDPDQSFQVCSLKDKGVEIEHPALDRTEHRD